MTNHFERPITGSQAEKFAIFFSFIRMYSFIAEQNISFCIEFAFLVLPS